MMKPNRLFKNAALSALLLSAVASPPAFAETSVMPVPAAPTVHVSAAATLDPLKLSETYAPELVEEWKQTMSEYTEALGANVRMTISSVPFFKAAPADIVGGDREPVRVESFIIRNGGSAQPLDIAFGEGIASPTLGGNAIALPALSTNAIALPTLSEGAVELPTLSANAVRLPRLNVSGVTLPAPEQSGSNVTINIASTEALPISAFAQGWLDLNAAVQANDAAAIKQALIHQLELYKEEIAKLKAGEKPMALFSVPALRTLPAEPTVSAEEAVSTGE